MTVGKRFTQLSGLAEDAIAYQLAQRAYRRLFPLPDYRKSYSQFGEDMILLNLLGNTYGSFVDIGSGHPIKGSNTYALYQRGWSGISVDPLPQNIELARKLRPRDSNLVSLCGGDSQPRELFEYADYAYSTLSRERVVELSSLGINPVDSFVVPSTTLKDLGVAASPEEASLLCIDTEGWELEVLHGNDWTMYRPGVICVEDLASPLEHQTPIQDLLNDLAYSLVGVLGFSSIYCHRDSGLID